MANKVVIDTELNSKPIVRSVSEIEKAMKKVEGEQDKLSAKMEKFGKLTGNEKSKAYKSMLYDAQRLDDKMSDLTNELVAARKVENDLAAKEKERLATLEKIASASKSASSAREGVRSASDKEGIKEEAKKLFDARNSLINAINEFKSRGGDVTSEEFKGANEELAKIRNKILELKSSFNALSGNGTESKGIFSGLTRRMRIPGEQIDQGENTVSVLERIKSAANKAGNAIKGIGDNAKKSHSNTSRMLRTLFRYTIGIRSLFTLFNKLRSGVREGIDNMSRFNKAVNPINDALSNIKSSLTYMKNSFASAFAPILTTITPAITALMDSVSEAMTKFGMFVAALNGQKTFIKATKVMEDYNQELKETNTQLGKLDELNNVDLSETTKAFDKANSQFEEVNIDEDMFGIAEAFKQGSLGKIIAEALNKGISAIGEEGNEINFEEVGKKIAGGVNDFFATFNFEEFAQTLNTWARGIYTTLKTIIVGDENGNGGIDWGSVWDGVTTLLSNLELSTIVTLVVGGFTVKNGIVGSTSLVASAIKKIFKALGVKKGAIALTAIAATILIGSTITKLAKNVKSNMNKEIGEKLFGEGVSLSDKVLEIKEKSAQLSLKVTSVDVEYDEQLKTNDATHTYIQGLIDKFFELKSNVNLTSEQLTELQTLQKTIEEYIPGFSAIVDDQTLSYQQQRVAVDELMASKQKEYMSEIARSRMRDQIENMIDAVSQIKGARSSKEKAYKELVDLFGGDEASVSSYLKTGFISSTNPLRNILDSAGLTKASQLRSSIKDMDSEITKLTDDFDKASESANEAYNYIFGTNNKTNNFGDFVIGGKYVEQSLNVVTDDILDDVVVGDKLGRTTTLPDSPDMTLYMNGIRESGEEAAKEFNDAFGNNLNLNGPVTDKGNALKDKIGTPGSKVRSNFYNIGKIGGEVQTTGYENNFNLKSALTNVLDDSKESPWFVRLTTKVGNAIGENTATSIDTKANQNKATTDIVSLYESGADDAEKKVSNPVSAVSKSLSNIGKAIAEGVKNGIVLKKNIFLDALLSLVPENMKSIFSTGLLGAVAGANAVTSSGSGGGGSKSYNGFALDYRSMDLGIPYLASGAVIPPNKEFLAVLGDQKAGTNVEAPLSTIQEAVRNEIKNMKVTVEVVPDKSGIFKAVRVAAQEYTATTGNYAF